MPDLPWATADASGRPTRAVNGRVACLVPHQPAEKTDMHSRLPVRRKKRNNKIGGLPYKICPRCRHVSSHSRSLRAPLACCQLLRGGQPIPLATTHKPWGVGEAQHAVLKILGQSEPCSRQRWAMPDLPWATADASGRPTRAVNGRVACLVPHQPAEKTDMHSRLPVRRKKHH